MHRDSHNNRAGFTMLELLITLTIALILVVVLGTVITDGWRTWNHVRDRIFSDVFEDSFVVRRFFDATIRKSSGNLSVGPSGQSIKAYYYENDESTFLDRYSRLFIANGGLKVEYGQIDSEGNESTIFTKTICYNVSKGVFSTAGKSAQMALELDNEERSYVVVTSAVAHN